jgi:chromosome segregation ATPase
MTIEPDSATGEDISSLAAQLETASERISSLRERAVQLRGIHETLEERLAMRAAELEQITTEARENEERIVQMRAALAEREELLASVRTRLGELARANIA